jgi:hypothetical protein
VVRRWSSLGVRRVSFQSASGPAFPSGNLQAQETSHPLASGAAARGGLTGGDERTVEAESILTLEAQARRARKRIAWHRAPLRLRCAAWTG